MMGIATPPQKTIPIWQRRDMGAAKQSSLKYIWQYLYVYLNVGFSRAQLPEGFGRLPVCKLLFESYKQRALSQRWMEEMLHACTRVKKPRKWSGMVKPSPTPPDFKVEGVKLRHCCVNGVQHFIHPEGGSKIE